ENFLYPDSISISDRTILGGSIKPAFVFDDISCRSGSRHVRDNRVAGMRSPSTALQSVGIEEKQVIIARPAYMFADICKKPPFPPMEMNGRINRVNILQEGFAM